MSADLFRLTDDQRSVREAIREIAEAEIAPFAAECDEQERYPIEAQKALTAAGFHAVHIPEAVRRRGRRRGQHGASSSRRSPGRARRRR